MLEAALYEIRRLDLLARGDSAIHRLDPRVTLLVTLAFCGVVVSFHPYDVLSLLPFAAFPGLMIGLARLPLRPLLLRLALVSPFAVLMGAANPFLDHTPITFLSWTTTGGVLSFVSILVRFTLTVLAALALLATTGFDDLCAALQRLGVPRVMVTQLLLLHRYVQVLLNEAARVLRARDLRSAGRRGQGIRPTGALLGRLALRTLDRAGRIHRAMLARGFDGLLHTARPLHIRPADVVFLAATLGSFVALRLWPLSELLDP